MPTRNPGVYRFQFYVDSTILCAEVEVTVVPAVTSTALPATSVAEVGSTQTRVPSLVRDAGDNADNGSDGDNDNDAEDGDNDSADNGDNGDNEAAIREPSIQSLSSESLCPGSTLRIEGRGFGDQQSAVGGSIVIGNAQVRDYLSWTDREIVVLVPNSAVPGENRQLFVITDGGFDESELEVADSGCQEDNEAALRTPTIQSLSSERLCPGTTLRIEGRGFGEQRSAAGGSIVIGNAQVRDYLSWTDRAIVVLVPTSAVPGENRLFIVTDGGFDESELEVADSGCSEAPPAQPAPSVRSVDPSQVCAQSVLVIRGAGFGESRNALQGKVVIGGAEVRDYLAWRDNQLTVLVPAGAIAGTQQRLYVLTIAGFDDIQIQIDSPPC